MTTQYWDKTHIVDKIKSEKHKEVQDANNRPWLNPPFEKYFIEEQMMDIADAIYKVMMKQSNAYREHELRKEIIRAKKLRNIVRRNIGPAWFQELTHDQVTSLKSLQYFMYMDILEDTITRIKHTIELLDMNPKPTDKQIIRARNLSNGDPVFLIYYLYKEIFNKSPFERLNMYCYNACILMTCIFYLSSEIIMRELSTRVQHKDLNLPPSKPPRRKNVCKPQTPYLEKYKKVPLIKSKIFNFKLADRSRLQIIQVRQVPINHKGKDEASSPSSTPISINCEAGLKTGIIPRQQFEPPKIYGVVPGSRFPKPIKRPATPIVKPKPLAQGNYVISGIQPIQRKKPLVVIGGIIGETCDVPRVHGGMVMVKNKPIPLILNSMGDIEEPVTDDCKSNCNCMRFYKIIVQFCKLSKCRCGHHYDFYNAKQGTVDYFHPPTKEEGFWFDYEKIFANDFKQDFISKCVEDCCYSISDKFEDSEQFTLDERPAMPNPRKQLKEIMRQLSSEGYVFAKLPDIDKVQCLVAWIKKMYFGELTPKQHRNLKAEAQKLWSFKFPYYYQYPCSNDQRDWTWLDMHTLRKSIRRQKKKFWEQIYKISVRFSMFNWASMHYDHIPIDSFRTAHFTYLPVKVNEYKNFRINRASLADRSPSHVCPLS